MTYDSEVLEVWLDELSPEPAPVQEVCEFHAGRLTAPRDWTVSDRRAPRPTDELLPSGRPPSTVAAVPVVPPATSDASRPPLPEPASEPAPSSEPSTEPSQDAPTGSLLARAFRSTGRRTDAQDRP